MEQYKQLVKKIKTEGTQKGDRTGTGTKSIFGHQMRFNLNDGFPLVTLKNTYWKGVVHELLWFLNGDTNTNYLVDNNVHIWDEWADENGDLGPVYGKQWVNWGGYHSAGHWNSETNSLGKDWTGINQVQNVIDTLKTNPDSRRMIVSAWNVGELDEMALMPCHAFFQFYTRELTWEERKGLCTEEQLKGEIIQTENGPWSTSFGDLTPFTEFFIHRWFDERNIPKRAISLQLYQRSCDTFLGLPFNIASYSLLLMMVAQTVNMVPEDFVWTGGDTHLYDNHEEQVEELLSREPKPLPTVKLNPEIDNVFDFTYDDIELVDYNPHPSIKAPVAV